MVLEFGAGDAVVDEDMLIGDVPAVALRKRGRVLDLARDRFLIIRDAALLR